MKRALTIPRTKTAGIFIDLQEEHRRDKRYLVEGFDKVIANVQRLQRTARLNGIPLYHCAYVVDLAAGTARPFHPVMPDGKSAFSDISDPLSAVCPEVAPSGDEPLVIKSQASAFGAGDLSHQLRSRGVEWLIVAGVWTEACVDATVKDAIDLGFRVILVKDACGSGTVAMHQTGILNLANRLYGGAVTDTAGACRLMAGETIEARVTETPVPLRFTFENATELFNGL